VGGNAKVNIAGTRLCEGGRVAKFSTVKGGIEEGCSEKYVRKGMETRKDK